MKKKILSLCLVVCLAATAIIGGTLAYFTDADKDVNVMTAGNVKIVQNETDRNGNAYTDGQKLFPAVYKDNKLIDPVDSFTGPDGESMKMHTDKTVKNVIDKVVSVTNNGSEDAYVRTIVLCENNEGMGPYIHYLRGGDGVDFAAYKAKIQVDGTERQFSVWYFVYKEALASGQTSAPSLKQIWIDPTAGNEWSDLLVDGKMDVIAISQAVQTKGFDSAAEALDAAFGELNEENIAKWLSETNVETSGLQNVVGGSLDSETAEG